MTDSIASISFLPYVMQLYSKTDKPKITQVFHLLIGFAENQICYKIQNSIRVNEGSDKGDLDTQGATSWAVQYNDNKHNIITNIQQNDMQRRV